MDAHFMAELNERLFTHFTAGAWRAPLSLRLMTVGRDRERPLGQIACADARDLTRALAGVMRAAGPAPSPEVLLAAIEELRPGLARLRAQEGFAGEAAGPLHHPPLPALPGPLVLLSSAALPVTRLIPFLVGGAARGLIWKPAPGAAASAHLLMRALGPLASGRLAMVQGDHATGAALAGMGALVWASASAPPEDLPAPVFRISAEDPARP